MSPACAVEPEHLDEDNGTKKEIACDKCKLKFNFSIELKSGIVASYVVVHVATHAHLFQVKLLD